MSMQLPMKHLSCNKIINNKMVVRLKTLSKFAPSMKTSSQQLLKKDIEKIINRPKNCLKSSNNLSTFYCTKGALSNTKTITEISPCNVKRNTIKLSKKINRVLSSQEENLNTLYSESRNMNYALNSDDYVSDLKKYFYQYPKKRNPTDLSNMFTIRKKEFFNIYLKTHLFNAKISEDQMSSKLEDVYSNISSKIVNSKYKGLIEKMQNVENTINIVDKKYTKSFSNWYSF